MAESRKFKSQKEMGCGFMVAIFNPRRRKPPSIPQLEASKDHHNLNNFPANHNSKRNQSHRTTTADTGKQPPILPRKPANMNNNAPRPKPVSDSLSRSAFYSVSQVTNVSYTRQLRKEPSFASSELSLRVSTDKKSTPTDSMYQASSGNVMVPSHLGNLRKKPDISMQVGNIYSGKSGKKMDPENFKNMGNEKFKQGRYEEAVALYTKAIAINSNTASYYSNRSAALINLGKLVDALLDCKVAIHIDPSYHRAHYRLANLYIRFGQVEKASYHFKCSGSKAEGKDIAKAEVIKAQLNICSEARRMKDWKRLLKESQFTASLGADSAPQVYAMQAEALINLHRQQEACSGFENAPNVDISISTQLFGSTVTAYFLTIKAQVYLASARFEEAVTAAVRATELESSEEVRNVAKKTQAVAKARASGNKIFKASKFSEACNVYSEGLEHEPYNSVLLCNRAACRFKLGQFEKAVEDCTTALNLRPSYAKARLRRAECNAKLERWEAAIQDYEVLNQETLGGEEVERGLLDARVQLKKQHAEDAKYMKLMNNSSSKEFAGFLMASGGDQRITIA